MSKKKANIPAGKPATKPTRAAYDSSSQTPRGWQTYALIVLAITAACYFPTLSNGLVNWDDDPNITENPNLLMVGKGQSWGSTITSIFDVDKGAVIGNYNPLPILSFAVEKSIMGGEISPGFIKLIHFDNLLLHALTVFLVMKLLLAMGFGNWGSFVGGLLFGIHPMRVESVAWATERKDVLFAVFFFAALLYYVKWLRQGERGEARTGTYMIMLVAALLSSFAKVQAVTLPLSMLVLDYWFRRDLNFKLILEKAPFWLISLAFGLINLYTLKQQGSTNDDITNFNIFDRLCIGAYSLCVYLYKLILPYPMSPLYPYPKPLPVYVYAAPLAFAGMCYWIWRSWKTENRIWVAGGLFFFFNVMFLLQVLGAGQGFLADRFTYVPYFGLFAIIAWYAEKGWNDSSKKGLIQGVVAAAGLVYAFWTVKQIGIWKNGDTLWSHVMKYEKTTNSLPYWNRGQYYRGQGNYEGALRDYTQAVEIDKKNPELLNSRGKTYFDMAMSGKFKAKEAEFIQKALSDYTEALTKPNIKNKSKAEVLINRGAAYGAMTNYVQAVKDLTEGLNFDPTNKNGYFNRSIVYFQTQQFENALKDYQDYLKLDPYHANIWYEQGMLLRSLNRNEEAIKALDQAISLNANLGIAYLERARAKAQAGNKSAAQQDYQKATQLGMKTNELDAKLMGK
ncbi:MAG: tetratricopeptide repeat protein [Saprospiraceae bacterium]|nr:tetratricopeptide repeat protein [Saprospiraceae bacterium]